MKEPKQVQSTSWINLKFWIGALTNSASFKLALAAVSTTNEQILKSGPNENESWLSQEFSSCNSQRLSPARAKQEKTLEYSQGKVKQVQIRWDNESFCFQVNREREFEFSTTPSTFGLGFKFPSGFGSASELTIGDMCGHLYQYHVDANQRIVYTPSQAFGKSFYIQTQVIP